MNLLMKLVLVLLISLHGSAHASEEEEIAHALASLFKSSKTVISDNQKLIDDPNIADKGLTGDVVIAQAKPHFLENFGKSLESIDPKSRMGQMLQAELDSIHEVMKEAAAEINVKGRGFKGFLAAVFARKVAEKTSVKLKGQAQIKLTAPKYLVRNRHNNPDQWETDKIDNFFSKPDYKKGQSISELAKINDKDAYRIIFPEYYKASCLACHGDPKGEIDISGGVKDGAKLGDLGGAISVTVFKQ